MSIWNALFGARTAPPSQRLGLSPELGEPAAATPVSSPTVEVPNQDRWGDGASLRLSANPDVPRMLSEPSPAFPLVDTPSNRRYWDGLDIEKKRNMLAIAFLKHPCPPVRLATVDAVRSIRTVGVSDQLINLLGDAEEAVARAAASALWQRQRDNHCAGTVKALRDEIRGSTSTGTTDGLVMGRQQAIRGLDHLIASAPDEQARKAIAELADREVVITERIKVVDTSSVQFVRTEQRKQYVYDIHHAASRGQALAFLKERAVKKPLYYIEVETPDGTFGRDLSGIYW